MDWIQFINQIKVTGYHDRFAFHSPATQNDLQQLKEKLGLKELPAELEELYSQTNGITEIKDGRTIGELIWTVEKVIETNLEQRNYPAYKDLYTPFNNLLFVCDAGNGDLFGYVTINGRFNTNSIYTWNHETDERIMVAGELSQFIKGWLTGQIQV